MKKMTSTGVRGSTTLLALAMSVIISTPVSAQQLQNDCAADLKTYCATVTPGADRQIACLLAFEDKVTPRCRLTAYLGSGNLEIRLKALQSVAKVCSSDILQYCSKVAPGGGRIYDCLKAKQATLTDDCRKNVPAFENMLKD